MNVEINYVYRIDIMHHESLRLTIVDPRHTPPSSPQSKGEGEGTAPPSSGGVASPHEAEDKEPKVKIIMSSNMFSAVHCIIISALIAVQGGGGGHCPALVMRRGLPARG